MSYKIKILNGVLKLKTFSDVVLNILGIKDLGTQTGNVNNSLVDWSIQHLTKTTAEWGADTTTILLKGQLGIEDTGGTAFKLKIGNGVNLWSSLSYISGGGGGGGTQDLQSVTDYGNITTNTINIAGVTSDYLQIDTTATPTNAIGKLIWNDSLGTAEIGLKGGSINAKLAQDLYARVVNKTGSNLLYSQSKVVKVSTAQGQRLAVNLAQANNDLNSADTIGIVAENIDNNQEGFVITVGQLTGLNTTGSLQGETWADGDVLYLSPTTAGAITKVKPDGSTGHIVVLGYVEYAHQNNGKIYVKIMNGWELDELHNVYISSISNNQVLTYESATQLWKNKTVNSALGYTAENTANKGVANGYAPLASDGKVDAAYLPAYVDEVLEYANLAAFPVTGASDKIYIALDTNKVYRWSGSTYIEVAANSGVWGAITGTLSNQTDLVNYVKSIGRTTFRHSTVTHVNVSYGATAGNRWYPFSSLGIGPQTNTSDPGTTSTYIRAAALKTGNIVSAKISWFFATATPPANTNAATLSIRNATASSTHTITSSLVLAAGATSRGYVQTVSGLNIPVTENDQLYSVIFYPQITTGNSPQILGLLVDYIIE